MVEMSRRPRISNQWVSDEEVHSLVLVFHLLPSFRLSLYLFSIWYVVGLMRLSDTNTCSCLANYLVELLQLLVGAGLCLSFHRPFTRSALTVRNISTRHSSIGLLPPRLRISGRPCDGVSQIFVE
jgi:hypothetical protein